MPSSAAPLTSCLNGLAARMAHDRRTIVPKVDNLYGDQSNGSNAEPRARPQFNSSGRAAVKDSNHAICKNIWKMEERVLAYLKFALLEAKRPPRDAVDS